MAKYFDATDEYGVETTRDMDTGRTLPPGAGLKSGTMRLHFTVYEPGDPCEPHPSLPTLGELLARNVDPQTGLLTFDRFGVPLSMDPAPLRELPREYLDYRVTPGCTFVTHDAIARTRAPSKP